jgi:pyruvate/2-oxoglutarate dehydrogenase complex dihydrolipoamide acyltransferase (E2) component
MPLFRRPDGDLVKNESLVRRMIPYIMLGRNEAAIYHTEVIDLAKVRAWIRAYNHAHAGDPITMFHLFLYAIARGFHARPGMNRFVSGGRIYQRRGVWLSFAAKKKFDEKSPLVTVKLEFPEKQTFPEAVRAIKGSIGEGRSDKVRTVDKELKLAMSLPGVLLRGVMAALRFLDRMNLMPAAMIRNDPMYCSAFVANLGSVGIDRTYHHMYEYGTASLFGVIGVPRKNLVVGAGDKTEIKEQVELRWTFDERINDGFYCAASMRYMARIVEDPDRYIGSPETGIPAQAQAQPAPAGGTASEAAQAG